MRIKQIVSNRKIDFHPATNLVYEWEDDMCKYFDVPLFYNHPWKNKRYSKYLPFILNWLQTSKPAFAYEMSTYRHNGNNKRNLVPCIIDFYLRKPWQVYAWYAQYWRNPVICVSSREVYHYLHEEMGLRKIEHLPLSLSDRYRITGNTQFKKKYDILLAGRQNKVLKDWFARYLETHPDTTFIRRDMIGGKPAYIDQAGQCVSDTDSREIYMHLIQQVRACLYATPGMDGGRSTNGFNQVTPRFLEIIAAGCQPLMRYPKNADTAFYQLGDFCPNIETYGQFEVAFDKARRQPVDMEYYATYMERHYTSVVAQKLEQILFSL